MEGVQEEGVQEEGVQEEGVQEEGIQEEGIQGKEGFRERRRRKWLVIKRSTLVSSYR